MVFPTKSNPSSNEEFSSSSEGMPRCARCGVVISSSIRLKALGQDWHQECFSCIRCGKELKGGFFPHENKPYCEEDYDDMFLKKCTSCSRPIEGTYFDDRRGGFYHAACFKCNLCGASLESSFIWNDQGKICCEPCGRKSQKSISVTSATNERCGKCNKPFENGSKMLNVEEGIKYHEHCFTCFVCGTVIGVGSYTLAPFEEHRYCCMRCADNGRAEKCAKCGQVMLTNKINALGKKFHEQCFKCSQCGTSINENEDFFTSSIGQPLCKGCFEN